MNESPNALNTPNTPNGRPYTCAQGRMSQAPIRESEIEATLCRKVKELGGLAVKLTSPGLAGVPDRMILSRIGKVVFVELKAPGRKPTEMQLRRHKQLRDLGFYVRVVDSKEEALALAKESCG